MKPRVTAYWYYESAEEQDPKDQMHGYPAREAETDDYTLKFEDIIIEGQPPLAVSVCAGELDGYYSVVVIRDGINVCNVTALLGNYLNVWTIMQGGLHFFVHIESRPIEDPDDRQNLDSTTTEQDGPSSR